MATATDRVIDRVSLALDDNAFPAFGPESHWENPYNAATPYPAPLRIRTTPRRPSLLDRITRERRDSSQIRADRHGASPSQSSIEVDLPPRPSTSMSETRRRKTDPLEHIRNTLFGTRDKTDSRPSSRNSSSSPRPFSRQSLSRPASAAGQESFHNEEQYYHHLRKNSISRPFNFKHLAHTAQQTSLTPLSEKEAENADSSPDQATADHSGRPRAPSLPSHPLRHAMSMDHLLAHPNRSLARQAQVVARVFGSYTNSSNIDSTTTPSTELVEREGPTVHKYSKSSPHVDGSSAVDKPLPERPLRSFETSTPFMVDPVTSAHLDVVPEETNELTPSGDQQHYDRRHHRLPSLPTHEQFAERDSLQLGGAASSYIRPAAASSRSMSKGRRNASRSRTRSPALSLSSYSNDAGRTSGASWEDEVDFMYEQQAESTCDFDWNGLESLLETPELANSPSLDVAPKDPRDTIVERPSRPDGRSVHQRGGSIGHLGFLAARRTSIACAPTNASHPFTLAEVDERKEHGDGALALHCSNAGDLSDPESVRTGGAKHRKSSSYGSNDATTRSPSLTAQEAGRWSVASSSSSSGPSKSSQSRLAISAVKSAASAPSLGLRTDVTVGLGRLTHGDYSPSEPFYMRRPQTSGERSVLQAAGRAVQRGRPLMADRCARTAHGIQAPMAALPRVTAEEPSVWI